MSDLEKEAQEYLATKRTSVGAFKKALAKTVVDLIQFVEENTHDTAEREEACKKLLEFGFWIHHCVDTHGVREQDLVVEDTTE